MNSLQKTQILSWFIVIYLIISGCIYDPHKPYITISGVVLTFIFYVLNYKDVKVIERMSPTPADILRESRLWRGVAVIWVIFLILTTYYFIFTAQDIGKYIGNYYGLSIPAILIPLAGPVVVSQFRIFHKIAGDH